MEAVDSLLQDVQKAADHNIVSILQSVLHNIIDPPISSPSDKCEKHNGLLQTYKNLAVLKTFVNRAHRTLLLGQPFDDKYLLYDIDDKYIAAKKLYRETKCTCDKYLKENLISPFAICSECRREYRIQNNCRQPLHVRMKREEKKIYLQRINLSSFVTNDLNPASFVDF